MFCVITRESSSTNRSISSELGTSASSTILVLMPIPSSFASTLCANNSSSAGALLSSITTASSPYIAASTWFPSICALTSLKSLAIPTVENWYPSNCSAVRRSAACSESIAGALLSTATTKGGMYFAGVFTSSMHSITFPSLTSTGLTAIGITFMFPIVAVFPTSSCW